VAIDRPAGETPLTDAARGCSSPPYTSSVTPPDIPIPPNIATPIGKATAGRESNPAYDALADPVLPLQDVVLKSQIPRLFIIPSHINLAVTELEFGGRIGRERLSKKKIDPLYTAGSMYRAWKGWSFADKKHPSPWLTFLVLRVLTHLTKVIKVV